MPNLSQICLIKNWNSIVEHLKNDSHFERLPTIDTEGICCGLVFMLGEYIRSGSEDEFFKKYHLFCVEDPVKVAEWIRDNNNQEYSQQLLDFIRKIILLQNIQESTSSEITGQKPQSDGEFSIPIEENQKFKACSDKKKDRYFKENFLEGDHSLIDNQLKRRGYSYLRDYHDISHVIRSLNNGSSCVLSVYDTKTRRGHAYLVYKKEPYWYTFDPNQGFQVQYKSPGLASRYFVSNINGKFISASCPSDASLPTNSLLLYYGIIESLQSEPHNIINNHRQYHTITVKKVERIKQEYTWYKNNRYFGFSWFSSSKDHNAIMDISDATITDEQRYEIARDYVEKNPKNALAEKIKEMVPSLRTKKYFCTAP